MFCRKCGNEISPTGLFCSKCGTRVETEIQSESANHVLKNDETTTAQQPAKNYHVSTSQGAEAFGEVSHIGGGFSPKAPKFNLKKILLSILIPVVLVLAICIGAFAHPSTRNGMYRLFMSDKAYFKHTMNNNIDDFVSDFSSDMKLLKGFVDGKKALNVKIDAELGDGAKELIRSSLGADSAMYINWLKNAGVSFDAGIDGDAIGMGMGVSLNGEPLADADFVFENGAIYASVPNLNGTAIRIIPENSYQSIDTKALSEMLDWLISIVPGEEVLSDIISRYTRCVVNNISKVDEENITITAGGISQKAVGMTVTIDAATLVDIAKACLNELKNDKAIKDIIKNICENELVNQDFDTVYNQMQQGISTALASIESAPAADMAGEIKIPIRFIADKKGNLIGADMLFEGQGFKYYNTQNGKNCGTLFSFESGVANASFEGSSVVSGGKYNGNYALKAMGVNVLDVKLENVNKEKFSKGNLVGKMTISAGKGLSALLLEADADKAVSSFVSALEIVLESDYQDADKGNMTITLNKNSQKLIALNAEYDMTQKPNYKVPASYIDSTNTEQMQAWGAQCVEKLIERLGKVGLPTFLFR